MSCLFDSLSYFSSNASSQQLRNIICNYLLSNPTILDDIRVDQITEWESDTNINQYVQNMRNDHTWGSSLEIKAFSDLFKIKVNVHIDNRIVEFIPKIKPIGLINIRYTGRNHYTPI